MKKRIALAVLAVAVLVPATAWRAAAADRDRGMVLYEARCVACHATGVHTRENRKARNFEDVRDWVFRWSNFLGSDWGPAEVDDVSRYVNERYYGFPCPTAICSLGS
jgi:mono/diheme cytochrome c family protein